MTTIEQINTDTGDARGVPSADEQLKAKHRAMWASGDYPSMVETFLLPLGPALVRPAEYEPRTQFSTLVPVPEMPPSPLRSSVRR